MKNIRQTDADFISYVATQEPQGAALKDIATACKLSIQNAYRYARKLIKRGLIRKDESGFYHTSNQGKEKLNDFKDATRVGVVSVNQEPFSSEQATNLHALQAHYKIYRTSYDRAPATLAALHIDFHKTGNPKHPTYTLKWQGISLRIGSKQLIAWGPSVNAPISIKAPQIVDNALQRNIEKVVAFLRLTGIRLQETIDHKPIVEVPYYELAIVNNDVAEKYAKKHHYLPLAYDRDSNKVTIWLDGTPAPGAFETWKDKAHEELRLWAQGIEDGVVRPYADEMQTRQDIADLTTIVKSFANESVLNARTLRELMEWLKNKR